MPNQKLRINLTKRDCQDLASGEIFNWTFTTAKDEDIDIHLFLRDEEEE